MSLVFPKFHGSQFNKKKARLQDRAFMLKTARQFFDARDIMEVDCPILSSGAPIDAHIDLITATYQENQIKYLHSSPEYGMKRLLVEGLGDIYQLSHVFRDGEWSHKHNPEFMMAEWYRLHFTLEQMIEETVAFIELFLGQHPHRMMSYKETFLAFTGIDCFQASEESLFNYIKEKNIPFYASIVDEGKDALLNLILGSSIEPQLGHEELFVLTHYPASQAALAKKRLVNGDWVAERFEVYYKGVELANGYYELGDAKEQRLRLEESNQQRIALGKTDLPLDEFFLQALQANLPECCGVAVGFDRLLMLRQMRTTIKEIIAWSWEET